MNYLFKNGRYMNEEGIIVATDLLVQDGKIAKVAENITADNAEVIDVNGKLIAPGLVDVHVHLREPGGEHKETIATGTLASGKRWIHYNLRNAKYTSSTRLQGTYGRLTKTY